MSVKWNIFTNIFSSNLPSSSLHIETKEGGGALVCVCVCVRMGPLVWETSYVWPLDRHLLQILAICCP